MLLLQQLEAIPVDRLAIEVNRENRSNGRFSRIPTCPGRCWIEIEGFRIDVREQRLGPGAENGADRGEKTESSGDDGVAGTNARPFERQP